MTGVYQILCASNGRRYIGSASNIAQRWRCHRTQLRANKHRNAKLQRAWNKYGEDAFEFSKLIECEAAELLRNEQFFLDFFRVVETGFNICVIAGSRLGSYYSPDVGKKIGLKLKGLKRSPETIERMRNAQLNKTLTPEHRRNISKAKTGMKYKPMTPEAARKLSEARSRIIHPPRSAECRRKISLAGIARFAAPGIREQYSNKMKAVLACPEKRKKIRDAQLKRWAKYRRERDISQIVVDMPQK